MLAFLCLGNPASSVRLKDYHGIFGKWETQWAEEATQRLNAPMRASFHRVLRSATVKKRVLNYWGNNGDGQLFSYAPRIQKRHWMKREKVLSCVSKGLILQQTKVLSCMTGREYSLFPDGPLYSSLSQQIWLRDISLSEMFRCPSSSRDDICFRYLVHSCLLTFVKVNKVTQFKHYSNSTMCIITVGWVCLL